MRDYDMHLAAKEISPNVVRALSEAGFQRDEFANLTHCHTGQYHGTFRGTIPLPSRELWDEIRSLLENDNGFSGYLEEEMCTDEWRKPLSGQGSAIADYLPPVHSITCPAGMRKACDIHIAVFLESSDDAAIDYMRRLEASSVDRPGPEGIRRVYTITCESLADGRRLFTELYSHFRNVPGLHGRMKLEVTTRHYRKPDDATTLPIATKENVTAWFAECRSRGLLLDEEDEPTEKRELVLV